MNMLKKLPFVYRPKDSLGLALRELPTTEAALRAELAALEDAGKILNQAEGWKAQNFSPRKGHCEAVGKTMDTLRKRAQHALAVVVIREKGAALEKDLGQRIKRGEAEVSAAASRLSEAQQARTAFLQRLDSARQELARLETAGSDALPEARKRLQAAVMAGNEQEEARAAAEIDRLEREAEANIRNARPLQIRIQAMEAQAADSLEPVTAAESALHQARKALETLRRELAAVRCDLAQLGALVACVELMRVDGKVPMSHRLGLCLGASHELRELCKQPAVGYLLTDWSEYGIWQIASDLAGPGAHALALLEVDPQTLSPEQPKHEPPEAKVVMVGNRESEAGRFRPIPLADSQLDDELPTADVGGFGASASAGLGVVHEAPSAGARPRGFDLQRTGGAAVERVPSLEDIGGFLGGQLDGLQPLA